MFFFYFFNILKRKAKKPFLSFPIFLKEKLLFIVAFTFIMLILSLPLEPLRQPAAATSPFRRGFITAFKVLH